MLAAPAPFVQLGLWVPDGVAVDAADVAPGEGVVHHLVPPGVVVGLAGEEVRQIVDGEGPVPVRQGHAAAVTNQGVLHLNPASNRKSFCEVLGRR